MSELKEYFNSVFQALLAAQAQLGIVVGFNRFLRRLSWFNIV